jgi:hypothetical protein
VARDYLLLFHNAAKRFFSLFSQSGEGLSSPFTQRGEGILFSLSQWERAGVRASGRTFPTIMNFFHLA